MRSNNFPHKKRVVVLTTIFFLFFIRVQVFGQCSIQTIPNDSVFCGNAKQLRIDVPWNTVATSVSGVLNALYFTSPAIGFAVGENGAVLKTMNGGSSWSVKNTPATGELKGVQFITDSIGYTAGGSWGSGGVFFKTIDAGETWTALHPTMATSQTINSLHFLTKDTGFVVGGDGMNYNCFILKTTNGGNNWSVVFSDTNYVLRKIFFVSPSIGYAAANTGKLLKTTNGGSSWSTVYTNATSPFTKILFVTPSHGFAIANGSGSIQLAETNDGGQTWSFTTQSSLGVAYNDELRDVHFTDSLVGYLFCGNAIYLTENGGQTWTYYNQGPGGGSHAFFMKNPETVYASRNIGAPTKIAALHFPVAYHWSPSVYLSDSMAAQPFVSPNTTTTYYVKATYANACVAYDTVTIKVNPIWAGVTQLSTTVNCGYQTPLTSVTSYTNTIPLQYRWSPTTGLDDPYAAIPKATPTTTTRYFLNVSTFNQCATPDSNDMSIEVVVLPLQVNAGVDRTLICGDSIKIVPQQPWLHQSIGSFSRIWFTSADTAYAIGGGVSKSTDGGRTWFISAFASGVLRDIRFVTSDVGYVVGDGGLCLKTTNAGATWQPYYVTNAPSIRAVWFTSIDTGYVALNNGVIRKTTNGALTWSYQITNTTEPLNGLFFTNASTGFAIGNQGVIRKTQNGGTTWSAVSSGTQQHLTSITFVNAHVGYITGSGNVVLKTTDGGNSWNLVSASGVYEPTSICFTDENTGYISGGVAATSAIATTNDGGLSWVIQAYGYTTITGLHAFNAQKVYALGGTDLLILPQAPSSYTWKNVSTNQLLNEAYFRPAQTATYAVSYHLNGCMASDTLAIHVTPLRVSVTPNFVSGMQMVCGVKYRIDSVWCNLPWNKVNYSWDSVVGLNQRYELTPEITLSTTQRYTLRASTTNGCQASDTVLIEVEPFRLLLPMRLIDNPQQVCGTRLKLDSIPTNSSEGAVQFVWQPGTDLNDSLRQNPEVTLHQTTTFRVLATTPSGCSAKDSVTINVYPLLVNAGNDKYVTCGTQTQFDSVKVNQTNDTTNALFLTYSWQPSTGLSSSAIVNPMVQASNSTYTLTVSNTEGCAATDSIKVALNPIPNAPLCLVTVNEQNKNVLVWEKNVQGAVDRVVVQKETNVTGQFATLYAIPYASYSMVVDSVSNALVQSSLYRLQYIDSCGLPSGYGAPHKTMHLTINKGMGTSWNLLWNYYQGFTPTTYNIYRGTDSLNLMLIGTTSGNNNSYTDLDAPEGNWYYQVEIVSPTACNPSKTWSTSRSNYRSTLYTGVTEQALVQSSLVYPNPCKQEFTVDMNHGDETLEVSIYTLQGVLVQHAKVTRSNRKVYLPDLASGVYIVVLNGEHKQVRHRLLKE